MKKGVKTPINSYPETENAWKIFALQASSEELPATGGMPGCEPTVDWTDFLISSA